jgi:hypothetical protein
VTHPYRMARQARLNRDEENSMENRRITWNDTERADVVREAIRLSEGTTMSRFNAVRQAQGVLPAERQRPLKNTPGFHAWLLPLWDRMTAAATDEIEAATPSVSAGVDIDSAHAREAVTEPVFEPQPQNPPVESEPVKPAGKHRRKSLVFWKDGEKRTVAAKSRELLRQFPDMKPLEAVRKANAYALPEARQRELHTISEVSVWIEPMWAQLDIDDQIAEARQHEQDHAEETRIAEQRERDEREAVERASAIEAAVNERLAATTFEGLIRVFANKLAREIMSSVGESIKADLTAQIARVAASAGRPNIPPPTQHRDPEHPRKPRVLVAGLINQQIEDIKHSHGDRCDFSFVKSQQEASGAPMRDKCRHVDIVFAMVDFIGHNIEHEAKRAGANMVRVNGSVSSLKRHLNEYLSGEAVSAR